MSIFTTPKRKRSRGAAAERTPVGTGRICSGAALQALEIDPLCLRTCALLRNKYGSFGLFDRSASALRAMRGREGAHTVWYAHRRDMTVSQSGRSAAALFSRSTPFKTDWFLVWRQLSARSFFCGKNRVRLVWARRVSISPKTRLCADAFRCYNKSVRILIRNDWFFGGIS